MGSFSIWHWIIVILLVMLGAAGLPGRYLFLLVAALVVLIVVTLQVGLLQKYQIERLTSFISPNKASVTATRTAGNAAGVKASLPVTRRATATACPSDGDR